MVQYSEDDMLMLSGIQHFVFCPRQWALIHIEQQWSENHLTTEGNILHTNVDNPHYRQKNGDQITLRSLHLASKKLGLYGIADAVELIPTDDRTNAITHPRYDGYWQPIPVEYKRGHSKVSQCDKIQVAAQAMAIEEMYDLTIDYGVLFYWETRRREIVSITDELRELVQQKADEMHRIFKTGIMPMGELKSCCKSCSLKDICMPQLSRSVKNYLKRELYEEIT
ncbi:MAG: CRISPR-associated protein Cas4 [Rikenellaceae bacterium]